MAKRVVNSDVIEPDLFGQTIKDSIALKTVLVDLQNHFAGILKTTRDIANSSSFASTKGIKDTTKAYEDATRAGKGYEQATDLVSKAEKRLEFALSERGKELAALNVKIQEVTKSNKEEAKAVNDTRGAYEKKSQNLSRMIKDYQNLAAVNKQNTVEAMALLKAIQLEDSALKQIDATVGRHFRNVGNYSAATVQLRGSISQIARELPSISNGLAVFFSAIGNNIAPASDAIRQFREEQKALAAEGKATQSVMSGLGSAIFSFNTLLLLGVTALTVFGPKLVEGAKSMLGFGESTKKAAEEQERLNKQLDETIKKTNTLVQNQQDEIAFQTEALVLQAKMNKATQDEIDAIEAAGRQKEIVKLQDDLDRKNQLYFKALEDKKAADLLFGRDEEKYKDLKIAADNRFYKIEEETAKAQSTLDRAIAKNALALRQDEYDAKVKAEEDAEKAAEEARKKKLEELEFQHRLNIVTIEGTQDTIIRKQALLEEDLRYQLAVNEILIENATKRNDMMIALMKKFELEFNETIKDQVGTIKEAKAAVAAELGDESEEERLKKAMAKMSADSKEFTRKRAAENRKRKKEQVEEEKQLINSLNQAYVAGANKRQQSEDKAIDRELNANQKRQDALREMAMKGNQDAKDNLALAQRQEAELAKRQAENDKKKARTELISTVLKTYAANVGRDPNTAFSKTSVETAALIAMIQGLPAFYEGTEDTGKGGGLDGKGGFLAINHPNERIMPADDNKKTRKRDGTLMTNEELADLAYMNINPSSFIKLPMVNHYHDDKAVEEIRALRGDIGKIKTVIENRPVKDQGFDHVHNMIWTTTDTKYKRELTRHKPRIGGARG